MSATKEFMFVPTSRDKFEDQKDLVDELNDQFYEVQRTLQRVTDYYDETALTSSSSAMPSLHASKHENGGVDEISVEGLSGFLADLQNAGSLQSKPVSANSASDGDVLTWNSTLGVWQASANTVVPSLSGYCQIKTGTYTGDGTTSQAITGVGFQPKYVRIWPHNAAEGAIWINEKTDTMDTQYCTIIVDTDVAIRDNRLISLDADGFTVDDDGHNYHPNKNDQVYDYLALV